MSPIRQSNGDTIPITSFRWEVTDSTATLFSSIQSSINTSSLVNNNKDIVDTISPTLLPVIPDIQRISNPQEKSLVIRGENWEITVEPRRVFPTPPCQLLDSSTSEEGNTTHYIQERYGKRAVTPNLSSACLPNNCGRQTIHRIFSIFRSPLLIFTSLISIEPIKSYSSSLFLFY